MSPLKLRALQMLEDTHRRPEMFAPWKGELMHRIFTILELVDLGDDFDHFKFRKDLFPYTGNGPTREWLSEPYETEWARKKIEDVMFVIKLRAK